MANMNLSNQPQKEEIGRAYIIKKEKFSIVPLYDYSELKIIDEVLSQNKNKKKEKKEKENLHKFFSIQKGE